MILKRMMPMHYELYVDSLFLVNFVMDLYLLLLVDRSTLRTATPGRLLAGAAVGGVSGLFPFLLPGPALFKAAAAGLTGTAGMILAAFPVKGFRMFLKLFERLILFSFCMGGTLLFLIRAFPILRRFLTGIFGIMGAGGLCCLLLLRSWQGRGEANGLCRAVLIVERAELEVTALVDSGNSLTEPISGRPVCIVEENVFRELFGEGVPPGYRVVPYHSIGKKRGIMKGCLLPELRLEIDGIRKSFREVCIAVSPQSIAGAEDAEAESVKMIINPALLQEKESGRPSVRQNERIYDTESGNTGKNAI